MSNFVTTYSNACGVKSAKNAPDFPSSYFPIPDKYITLQASGGHPARDYPLYSEVCNLLIQKFHPLGIQILQLGSENDTKIEFCVDLRGKTTIRQTAFIVENAMLHTGVDSSLSHLSGIKNIPLVTLCPNSHPNAIMPHYCHEKTVAIVSDRKGKKFSYDPHDTTILTIKPEMVANTILEIMGIEDDSKIETLSVGKHFSKQKVIDFVPNFPVEKDVLNGYKLLCRADLELNLNAVAQFFTLYQGTLVIDQSLPTGLINAIKGNISEMFIKLDKGYDKEFIKFIHKTGIHYILSFDGPDEQLRDIKLDLFDYNPVFKQIYSKKPVDISELSCYSIFRTNRSVFSDNKLYPSEAHWKKGISYSGEALEINQFFDDEFFWNNLDHFYLFNLKN